MKDTMKKTNISRRGKAKRIWNQEKLKMLADEADQAEIRMLLRLTIDDNLADGDHHGAIEFLEPWAEDNNDRYHWPMVKLCAIYTLLGDYEKALKLISDVLYHNDGCQLAQWYFAAVLFNRGQLNDAIEIWEGIVKKGAVKVARAKCDCGEGLEWAENLVADCKCALSLAFSETGCHAMANYWLKRYEEDYQRGRRGLMEWEIEEE